MSAFARWYVAQLKSRPILANLGSAFVLMSVGDLAAQKIESHQMKEEKRKASLSEIEKQNDKLIRRLSFRRYGTMSPNITGEQAEDGGDKDTTILTAPEVEKALFLWPYWKSVILLAIRKAKNEVLDIDWFRNGTMIAWSVGFYTPYFIQLYKLFDRYFPAGTTPVAVSMRVVGSFVASVPVNAAFFCYGCFVHHIVDWWSLVQEWQLEVPEADPSDIFIDVPLDWDMAWSAARLKLTTELVRTILASAYVWVPINIFNFSIVPPYLRPLTLMVCSAFWNCYLSLAQHREAEID